MPTDEFNFSTETLDGTRMLRLAMPETIAPSMLAAASANYLALWDTDTPTVGLGDISRLTTLNPEILHIFAVFARRVTILPNYVGSAWFTGPNQAITSSLRVLAKAADRDPNSIVETEAAALAYLRARIRAWKS